MTQDERLVPARKPRELDRTLVELSQSKGYGGRYGSSTAETNLKEYLFVILKRKWLILSLLLIITSLATIQAYRAPSIYEGATTIKIEQKAKSILQSANGGGIVIGQNDPNFWGTQLKLLQNETLARQVVLRLDLQHNAAFFGPQGQSTIFASLKRIVSRDSVPSTPPVTPVREPNDEATDDPELTPEQLIALEPYEDAITANELVEPQPQTNLVIIRYSHTDPVLAQKVADALADVFVEKNEKLQQSGTLDAGQQLAQEIAKYQQQVHEKEQGVFAYAKQYQLPLSDAPSSNLSQQRVATYSAQLLEAENQKRNLEAAYQSAKSAPDPFANPEVQKNERIVDLRKKLSDLKDKETALLQRYTKEWPEVQQVQAQIAQVEEELKKAPVEVLATMKARSDAAASQLKDLQSAYTRESGLTAEQTKNIIELASKRADLASDQQYLNTLFQKRRELNASSGDGGTSVSVENHSRLPRSPIGPQRLKTILIAFVLSLISGVGLAFLLDFLDDTIKSVDDVDRYINLPALALIPAVRNDRPRLRGDGGPADPNETTALAMVKDVRSPVAESYRHLRTSLLLSSAGAAPRTILVTSSQPSEGKTTTAINTAFMLAQTGAEVLIMDCDLRRPRLHVHFNISNARGLTNCLSGEASEIDSVIQSYAHLPNLKLLPSGPVPPNPAELLGSEEMRKLLVSLSEKFTHVIVDSPPAISFTDASILSTFVDGVILVVHGGRSSRAVVRRAKQQLIDIGAHIFGVVLNNVRVEKTQDYYYSGYYGYYKSGYYTSEEEPAPEQGGAPGS